MAWRFFLNRQTKVTANFIFERTLSKYLILAKLNVRQSVSAAKSPNLMSAECTTPTVHLKL